MKWTTELPDTKGWYWVTTKWKGGPSLSLIYINNQLEWHDYSNYDDEGIWRPVSEYPPTQFETHWMGPLEEPVLPDGSVA